ncbi:hypothetical protein ONR75_10380 [Rhodopseudomonas sp. P2A-2r]|uniref:hypothetical protein n=1 Tax=Rhodopseudomonas sp. P2A-2r TaxID=2991972 RepID=UPI00223417EC|nr:hypothetical protein [Rhodopseudomonas sp. P2A-2r]UZE50984.1 hypothetical protein ONR75_10380 [Rhodopseudomonas sp. P2A-2r]
MSNASSRLQVDAADFQIACRRFTIRATISRDKQLPVVDEFVLRLLASLDRISVSRMRAWFGFSAAEMETVLVDMGRRRLIEFDGDDVALAAAGRDLFRNAGDSRVPHVVEVAPLVGDVWFDLVSRSMVPSSRSRNVDYLVKLAEMQSVRELPEAFAREAFEENFRDYARHVRRFPDPDGVNLYSISDVEGGTYGYQVMSAELVLDMERMSVRPIFPRAADAAQTFQKLTVAANEAWQAAHGPDSATSIASEFERLTGDARLASLFQDSSSPSAWIDTLGTYEGIDPLFKPTLGAAYLPQNLAKALEVVAKLEASSSAVELLWLRPGGSAWGRSIRVAETLLQLRQALRNAGRLSVSTHLLMPRATPKAIRLNHKRVFDRGRCSLRGIYPQISKYFLFPTSSRSSMPTSRSVHTLCPSEGSSPIRYI